jgi:hypothetical protein
VLDVHGVRAATCLRWTAAEMLEAKKQFRRVIADVDAPEPALA